ncbi:serine/threonine-protein kinase [Dactylosporangium sp. CA-139114]|uniref:serine/threonine-protein kinase n=1 Tax=Dactylosporangium sp. CA-139114 TaxID=3239931 RepID=UPI003D995DCB
MTYSGALVAERYRLIEPLGTGGMGRVWLARDEMLRRDVAVKEVVPPEGLTREEREELQLRTLREARAAARLNDANVVRIYDVVHTEDAPWIVMEYVPSRSLHQVITEDGPLPPGRVAGIGLAVLSALKAAHAAGVLHRDVKPGNVLLADTGRVVLTDFGLAVFDGGDGAVTRPGLILGSPQYISPERAREGTSGPESDMWSLGATLYAAVEGRSPYARSTTYATLTALATEEPDAPVRAGVLKPVLNALLRKDPRARAGVAETERLLQRAASSEGRVRWSMPALPRPRRSREGHSGSPSGGTPRRGAVAAPVAAAGPVVPVSREPAAAADVSPGLASFFGPAPPPATDDDSAGDRLVPLRSADDDLDRTVPRAGAWRWAAAAVAVVALVITAVLLLADSGDEPDGTTNGPQGIGAPAAPAPSSAPGTQTATAVATRSPIVAGSIGGNAVRLPDGYEWITDPEFGWRVGLPVGWIRKPHPSSDSMVYYESNVVPGMRVGIDTTFKPPQGDPVKDWEQQEAARVAGNRYPNYHRLKIVPVKDYIGDCADWQWTYDSPQGHMHVSNLGCRIRPDLGQAIYWECTTDMWTQPAAQNVYAIIRATFQPSPQR